VNRNTHEGRRVLLCEGLLVRRGGSSGFQRGLGLKELRRRLRATTTTVLAPAHTGAVIIAVDTTGAYFPGILPRSSTHSCLSRPMHTPLPPASNSSLQTSRTAPHSQHAFKPGASRCQTSRQSCWQSLVRGSSGQVVAMLKILVLMIVQGCPSIVKGWAVQPGSILSR
jgi:hypothetical protein